MSYTSKEQSEIQVKLTLKYITQKQFVPHRGVTKILKRQDATNPENMQFGPHRGVTKILKRQDATKPEKIETNMTKYRLEHRQI